MTTTGVTDNAVRWLERLFRERISDDLVLTKQHDEQGECLYMRVNGSSGFMRFDAALPAFKIPCAPACAPACKNCPCACADCTARPPTFVASD